jgi:hypothetical protein
MDNRLLTGDQIELPFEGNIASSDLDRKFHTGTKIEILVVDEWIPGETIASHCSPDPDEDFLRIDVKTESGRYYSMCHPECVRAIKNLDCQSACDWPNCTLPKCVNR